MKGEAEKPEGGKLIADLDELVAELRDGDPTSDTGKRLSDLLRKHPECRDRFVRQMFLNAMLGEEGSSLIAESESRSFRLASLAYGLAAILLLALIAITYMLSIPPPPTDKGPSAAVGEWKADLESGLGSTWNEGKWVSDSLPAGSKGGVKMVPSEDGFMAGARDESNGLFEAFGDSHIRLVYKMDRPEWVNLFLVTQNEGKGVEWALHNFVIAKERTVPGTWYELIIPLNMVKGKTGNGWDGPPPSDGDRVNHLFFSNNGNDRGFVIDLIEVVRGGPGQLSRNEYSP